MKVKFLPICIALGVLTASLLSSSRDRGISIRLVHPASGELMEEIEAGQATVPSAHEVLEVSPAASRNPYDEERVLVSQVPRLEAEDFEDVDCTVENGHHEVTITLSEEGLEDWQDLTADHPGAQIAVTDGQEVLLLDELPLKPGSGQKRPLHFSAR